MLSIILTVYNKEPYLKRALDTLLYQYGVEQSDYEVIAVNDGSTDNSSSILEDYASRFPNLLIVTQNNQGLSMARNNGVEAANGEYVWFVDADDIIAIQSVAMLKGQIGSKPDVIAIYAKTNGFDVIRNQVNVGCRTGCDVLIDANWEHCGVFWVLRKQFLVDNKLKFIPGIYHEDAEFTPRMLYLAKSIIVLPEVLYTVYHSDEHSITEVPRPKRSYDMVFVVERLMSFFEARVRKNSVIWKVMCENNAGILNTALYVISCNSREQWYYFDNYLFEKKHVLRSFGESPLFKYKLEGLLFKLFTKRYVKTFYLIRKRFGITN